MPASSSHSSVFSATPLSSERPSSREIVHDAKNRLLVFDFGASFDCLSHAILNGGITQAKRAIWHEVQDQELSLKVDPLQLLLGKLSPLALDTDSLGLLTSAKIKNFQHVIKESSQMRVSCLATVGLGNARRIGEPHLFMQRFGTINVVCKVDRPMGLSARIEALAMISEAKCAAVMDSGVISTRNPSGPNYIATGTGTDCHVIASLAGSKSTPLAYAGKHTEVGELIGASTYKAVKQGCRQWLAAQQGAM